MDYRILLQYSPGLYGLTLLVLLWLPLFGKRIAGAKSWIKIGGGFQLQPSEFARISIALLLAWILENDDRPILKTRTIVLIAGAVGVPVLLVLLQPDLGVALTYMPFVVAALFFGGLKGRWWATLIVAGTLAVGGSWFLLKDYQKDRIRTFLDPNLAARGAGYQVRQARIAIGSGGILGKGWKQGTQSRLGFLPGAPHGLHLRGARRGVGVRRRRGPPRRLRVPDRAGARDRAGRARPRRVDARPAPRS